MTGNEPKGKFFKKIEKLKEITERQISMLIRLCEDAWFNTYWHLVLYDDGSGSIQTTYYGSTFDQDRLHRFADYLKQYGFTYFLSIQRHPGLHLQDVVVEISVNEIEKDEENDDG